MGRTTTYDFKRVVLTVAGHIVSGYADGTGITIAYTEDRWTPQTGSDGDFTRSRNNNNEGSITITLQQSSLSNDFLAGLELLDSQTNAGLVPVLLKDLNGSTVAMADKAYVQSVPEAEFGREAGERQWVLYTGNLQMFVGGIN